MSDARRFFKLYSMCIFTVLFCLMSVSVFAAQREDFVGAWLNDDPYTELNTRILLTPSGASDLDVRAFGLCYPTDCDWETVTAPFSGNPFEVVYHQGYVDRYMTLELLAGGTQMYVTTFHDYIPSDPRTDYTSHEYFSLMTEPDLVIDRVELPGSVVDYGVYNWVTFYVQNLGAEGVSGPLRARIVDRERNGEPVPSTGYFELSYTSPIGIGEEVSHQFAVGHAGSLWTDGDYKFRIEVDYDNLIPEADETNNISLNTYITIMEDYQLTGICRFNNFPMDWYTDVIPDGSLHISGVPIPGAEFRYYTETGRYAITGVPEDETVSVNTSFLLNEMRRHYPGNYVSSDSFDLSTMTPEERETFNLDFTKCIHMTRPWDNTQLAGEYPEHQPGVIFEWEPVTGTTEYLFAIDRYRSPDHPSGYGFIERVIVSYQPETDYTAVLPVSNPQEHYEALIEARNASSETIGRMYLMLEPGGHGFDYRFTVDYECYTLPKLRLFVTDMIPFEFEGQVYHRYHTAVTNWELVPDAMFEPAPDLAPCGLNTESSRTWVRLEDGNGAVLNNYCSIDFAEELNGLTFTLAESEPVPETVRMVLDDRRCGILYESILVDTTYPCPIGDLDGNCVVNLFDWSLFAGTWLMEGAIVE